MQIGVLLKCLAENYNRLYLILLLWSIYSLNYYILH